MTLLYLIHHPHHGPPPNANNDSNENSGTTGALTSTTYEDGSVSYTNGDGNVAYPDEDGSVTYTNGDGTTTTYAAAQDSQGGNNNVAGGSSTGGSQSQNSTTAALNGIANNTVVGIMGAISLMALATAMAAMVVGQRKESKKKHPLEGCVQKRMGLFSSFVKRHGDRSSERAEPRVVEMAAKEGDYQLA
eukprot:CAMPEP_0198141362 /NCGR_PEP_ID=MMETSP1443-20131203/4387_1 /TAXON_ID=186043 /ORGANISM="Entomoneis sp., Strain CCMP2396" /LENGTH=188 /DNA_ID=CAMNT_0043804095 /DNA_START=246 /DNA_END=812 /DNA_ORIENTATION=-